MKIKNRYTSVACNRTPEALDWGNDGLIYYGACHSIAIFDPKFHGSAKIIRSLSGHKARVNTIKKLQNVPTSDAVDIVSGSDDATCILWSSNDLTRPLRFTLKGHTKGVTQVDAFYVGENLMVATGSADSSIKLWKQNAEELVCFQTIDLKTGLCFALKFFLLPESGCSMLAYTTDNDLVQLYAASDEEYVLVDKLKGHTDWVRGLDCVTDVQGKDILLASASQDSFVRLWRISQREQVQVNRLFEELSIEEDIVLEERIFTVVVGGKPFHYALSLESVLQGHEGWVYGVHFNKQGENLNLLSSSIDKTLTIWTPSESGVWLESVRVGEVGGASLGFYGGKFSPDGKSIVGHGFQGSLHVWHQEKDNRGDWNPGTIIGGHFEAVRDLAWDPAGGFLVTVAADQTTRIHGMWQSTKALQRNDDALTWHEIARPQVHGYDMQCLCMLSRYRFASAAEEKIVRIFQAPGNFVENLRQLSGIGHDPEGEVILKTTPKGASVPSLGLSNKAVYGNEEHETESKHVKDVYPEHYFIPTKMESPPTEETLMQNTLWPEMQKLYGHGYEIYALASTPDGRFIASASRATSLEHAKILIWSTSTWKITQQLQAHQLTVTQLAFSPNGTFLLAVSRDRTLSVYENRKMGENEDFQLLTHTDKKTSVHARIIWCCDWSHDSSHFVTGSRDGKTVLWERKRETGQFGVECVLELKGESVTAVAFAKRYIEQDSYMVAVGLEKGVIQLYAVRQQDWKLLATIDESSGHHLTVKRLAFKPSCEEMQLASCGEDNFVRIYDIC